MKNLALGSLAIVAGAALARPLTTPTDGDFAGQLARRGYECPKREYVPVTPGFVAGFSDSNQIPIKSDPKRSGGNMCAYAAYGGQLSTILYTPRSSDIDEKEVDPATFVSFVKQLSENPPLVQRMEDNEQWVFVQVAERLLIEETFMFNKMRGSLRPAQCEQFVAGTHQKVVDKMAEFAEKRGVMFHNLDYGKIWWSSDLTTLTFTNWFLPVPPSNMDALVPQIIQVEDLQKGGNAWGLKNVVPRKPGPVSEETKRQWLEGISKQQIQPYDGTRTTEFGEQVEVKGVCGSQRASVQVDWTEPLDSKTRKSRPVDKTYRMSTGNIQYDPKTGENSVGTSDSGRGLQKSASGNLKSAKDALKNSESFYGGSRIGGGSKPNGDLKSNTYPLGAKGI